MSRDEVDRALERLGAESDRIAAALLDLDSHPGHLFLRGNSRLSGVTEQSWRAAQAEMATLWTSFDAYRAALDRIRDRRARVGRPSQQQLAALTELLRGRSVELSREAVPLERRSLTGPTEVRQWASLAEIVDGMNAAYTRVADVVAAVDQVWSALATRLTPIEDAWRAVEGLAAALEVVAASGPVADAFARCGTDLAELRELAFCDPLALRDEVEPTGGANGRAAGGRLSGVEAEIARLRDRLDALARLRDGFAARAAGVRERLGRIEQVRAETLQVWTDVVAKIASPGPPPAASPVPSVTDRLGALDAVRRQGQWQRLADELSTLEREVADAEEAAGAALRQTTELLDRRTELRGRLEAYRAMAARLGRAEDAELGACYEQARELLWTAPCDLRAATRALARYQQAVRGGAGAPQPPSRPGPVPRGTS